MNRMNYLLELKIFNRIDKKGKYIVLIYHNSYTKCFSCSIKKECLIKYEKY